MSLKREYDLQKVPFQIEQDECSTDIDIKLEFPYHSVQFPVNAQEGNEQQQKEHLEGIIKDPLELCDVSNHNPISHPSSSAKKLKKISTAICTKCNLGFPSPFLFEQHMIDIHQDERPYPCKHCGKPFTTRVDQRRHETIHDPDRFKGEPQFICSLCNKAYHLKRSLAGHNLKTHLGYIQTKKPKSAPITEHHSTSGVKNPNPYRKPKQVHSCPHCDLSFDMKCLLSKHMIVHKTELPFSCPICHQPFPRKGSMNLHIQRIHQTRTTPTGKSHVRPKWQANQPCPCTICEKIFPIPSQLSRHMRLHTGEKTVACKFCTQKFGTKQDLNRHIKQNHLKDQLLGNPLKLFKCRVCGKNDFIFFADLSQHRLGVHKTIPYDSEKEKPFACGICGKPHFLRESALICALLGHDPGDLRRTMFKLKCPECPPGEVFGYHNVLALRRHWEREHRDKQLPARFRQGMNGNKELKDELPSCKIKKVKRELIQKNGPDLEQVKREGLMCKELDLLEVPEEERFFKRTKVHLRNVGRRNGGRPKQIIGAETEGWPGMDAKCNNNIRLEAGSCSVNIKDQDAVQAILNFQSVKVYLQRVDFKKKYMLKIYSLCN